MNNRWRVPPVAKTVPKWAALDSPVLLGSFFALAPRLAKIIQRSGNLFSVRAAKVEVSGGRWEHRLRWDAVLRQEIKCLLGGRVHTNCAYIQDNVMTVEGDILRDVEHGSSTNLHRRQEPLGNELPPSRQVRGHSALRPR